MSAQPQKQTVRLIHIIVSRHSMSIINGCGSRSKNKSQSLGAKIDKAFVYMLNYISGGLFYLGDEDYGL